MSKIDEEMKREMEIFRKDWISNAKLVYVTVTRAHIDKDMSIRMIMNEQLPTEDFNGMFIFSKSLMKSVDKRYQVNKPGKYGIWVRKVDTP